MTTGEYLLVLFELVQSGQITVKEALQRASEYGRSQGRVEGLGIAKDIIGAPIK